MPYVFNPGYIGPNPPCCDPECSEESECPDAECGPCPGPQAPCGGCSPNADGTRRNYNDDIEACNNKADNAQNQTPTTINK